MRWWWWWWSGDVSMYLPLPPVHVFFFGLVEVSDLSGGDKSYMMLQMASVLMLVLASVLTSQTNSALKMRAARLSSANRSLVRTALCYFKPTVVEPSGTL